MEIIQQKLIGNFINTLLEVNLLEEGLSEYLSKAKDLALKFILDFVASEISHLDAALLASKERRQKWVVLKKEQRTQETILGPLYYERRYYQNKQTEERRFLLDSAIKVDRYERIDKGLQAHICNLVADHSYQISSNLACQGNVSKQSVMRITREVKLEEAPPLSKRKVPVLHIQADEDHISLQRPGSSREVRIVVIHEPIQCKGNKGVLPNKHILTSYSESTDDLWDRTLQRIYERYEMGKDLKIYIHGDGASWIKAGAKWLPNAHFVLDKYHALKYIGRIAPVYSPEYKGMLGAIRKGDKRTFTRLAKEVFEKYGCNEATYKDVLRYIGNNWRALVRAYTDPEAGRSCAEGLVSHHLSARLSSRPMAWLGAGVNQVSQLRAFRGNGNRLSWYDFVNKEDVTVAKEAKNDTLALLEGWSREQTDFLPMISSALKSPKRDAQFRLFKAITEGGMPL